MPLTEIPPPPEDWRPIDTIENVRQTADFLFPNGVQVRGDWGPFWCGDDCPCYGLAEGPSGPFSEYPMCWCVFQDGKAIETDPTYWRPVAA
jgi:hypothetical protein